jgi:stearoyl-CoA desaturase (delta-9 desaturase)
MVRENQTRIGGEMQNIQTNKRTGYQWTTIIAMIVFHALAVAALFFFSWTNLFVTLFLLWVSGSLGIGMGYHRLLTHRGFTTPKPVEYFLTLCGTLALESGPIQWVSTHRIHHAFTETEKDPHTPREGFWWSHIGWIFVGTAQHHDEVTLRRFIPDLLKDKFQVWISKWYYVPTIILGLILLAVGGWSLVLWGIFLRITVGLHITWLVNSATHIWGSRRFETKDDSTNNFVIALMTFGEGWHNNHHAHPTAARHGIAWYEIDFNWYGIRALEILGLAKNIKLIQEKKEQVKLKKAA